MGLGYGIFPERETRREKMLLMALTASFNVGSVEGMIGSAGLFTETTDDSYITIENSASETEFS